MRSTTAPRRAFVSVAVIITTGVLLMFVAVTARMAYLEMRRERTANLEAHAAQAILSARAWSEQAGRTLDVSAVITLPVDELVPRDCTGVLELRLIQQDGVTMIDCRLTLERGPRKLNRQASWPLRAPVP